MLRAVVRKSRASSEIQSSFTTMTDMHVRLETSAAEEQKSPDVPLCPSSYKVIAAVSCTRSSPNKNLESTFPPRGCINGFLLFFKRTTYYVLWKPYIM